MPGLGKFWIMVITAFLVGVLIVHLLRPRAKEEQSQVVALTQEVTELDEKVKLAKDSIRFMLDADLGELTLKRSLQTLLDELNRNNQ